jgi:hypothetical protein
VHAPGSVDNEYDVLAVHRNSADGVIGCAAEIRLKARHLFSEALQRRPEFSLVDLQLRRIMNEKLVLTLYRTEFLLQSCQGHFCIRRDLTC